MIELAGHLLALYVAIAMGFVGFGMMIAGPMGARRVARFLFPQPLLYVLNTTRQRLRQLLAYSWFILMVFVLGPVGRQIVRSVRWLVRS
jgi:hypothetical protein